MGAEPRWVEGVDVVGGQSSRRWTLTRPPLRASVFWTLYQGWLWYVEEIGPGPKGVLRHGECEDPEQGRLVAERILRDLSPGPAPDPGAEVAAWDAFVGGSRG